jgi:hypothetical protein
MPDGGPLPLMPVTSTFAITIFFGALTGSMVLAHPAGRVRAPGNPYARSRPYYRDSGRDTAPSFRWSVAAKPSAE